MPLRATKEPSGACSKKLKEENGTADTAVIVTRPSASLSDAERATSKPAGRGNGASLGGVAPPPSSAPSQGDSDTSTVILPPPEDAVATGFRMQAWSPSAIATARVTVVSKVEADAGGRLLVNAGLKTSTFAPASTPCARPFSSERDARMCQSDASALALVCA